MADRRHGIWNLDGSRHQRHGCVHSRESHGGRQYAVFHGHRRRNGRGIVEERRHSRRHGAGERHSPGVRLLHSRQAHGRGDLSDQEYQAGSGHGTPGVLAVRFQGLSRKAVLLRHERLHPRVLVHGRHRGRHDAGSTVGHGQPAHELNGRGRSDVLPVGRRTVRQRRDDGRHDFAGEHQCECHAAASGRGEPHRDGRHDDTDRAGSVGLRWHGQRDAVPRPQSGHRRQQSDQPGHGRGRT